MGFFSALKRLLFGAPIASSRAHHERLPKIFGLPVFASDAISSVAYATEEILLVLLLAGSAAIVDVIYIAIAISVLIGIVIFSYVRTIYAYPQGGGGYRVSSDNLGSKAGRVAGAALLIDYVLTVAVSVSSGILAIVSAFPALGPYTIQLGLVAIALMAFVNLRGTKESGLVFAIPTYAFVFMLLLMIVMGLIAAANGEVPSGPVRELHHGTQHAMGLWLILRAFSAGCTALTGIEAIADGVGAFKEPAAKNASQTLMMLGVILATLFIGVSWLAVQFKVVPMEVGSEGFKTVLAQISEQIFGNGAMFYSLQIGTMAILILAANTAYADFPRLCSFIAKDGFLPRQLSNLGDRLVFQNGIILLSVAAGSLIWVFNGDTHALIPLYAVGVFTSFTLSQAGMVVRQMRLKSAKWAIIGSTIGMVITCLVGVVIFVTKFEEGAWLILVACTVLMFVFWQIRKHYNYLAKSLNVEATETLPKLDTTVLLLVPRIHKGVLQAIAYAKSLSHDCRAIHISGDPSSLDSFKQDWSRFGGEIPLVILESPYRSLVEPLMEYIDEAVGEKPDHLLTVVVPQAVPKYWWQTVLHNNSALPIKVALGSRKNVVVTSIRYFLP